MNSPSKPCLQTQIHTRCPICNQEPAYELSIAAVTISRTLQRSPSRHRQSMVANSHIRRRPFSTPTPISTPIRHHQAHLYRHPH